MMHYTFTTITLLALTGALHCSDSESSKLLPSPKVTLGEPVILKYENRDGTPIQSLNIIHPGFVSSIKIGEVRIREKLLLQIEHTSHKDPQNSRSLSLEMSDSSYLENEQSSALNWIGTIVPTCFKGDDRWDSLQQTVRSQVQTQLAENAKNRRLFGEKFVPNGTACQIASKLLASKLVVAHGSTHVAVYPFVPAKQEDNCSIR